MEWERGRRQWAIDQCAADYDEATDWDRIEPEDWIKHWLKLNSHKYRTNYDRDPLNDGQIDAFVHAVMRLIHVPDCVEMSVEAL